MTHPTIQIAIAEDQILLRKAMAELLEMESDIRIVYEANNGLELLKIENSVLIDVVNCKNTLASVLGLALSHLVADDVEEFVEADGSVGVPEGVDEREDEGVPLVHS